MHWRKRMKQPNYNNPKVFSLTIRLAILLGMIFGVVITSITSPLCAWSVFLICVIFVIYKTHKECEDDIKPI
jgi:hypothetical protein